MFRLKKFGQLKIHINWLSIFQYAFVLCMVLNFRSIWLHTDSLSGINRIVKLLMGLSVVGGILAKKKLSSRRVIGCLAAMACVALYGGVWYLADAFRSGKIITILIQILAIVAYCVLVEDSVEDTMRKYTNIVLVIAVVSLFFWVFGSLLGRIHSTGALYTTWSDDGSLKKVTSYYGLYYETQSRSFFGLTGKIARNTAIFTEAPMASMVFSVAFLYEMLMRDKLNWKRCMILIVAIISTNSMAGITVLIMTIGLRYVFDKSKTKGHLSLKVVLLPIIFVAVLVAASFLLEQKLGSDSGSTRTDDFIAGYKAWRNAPFFGNGYGNTESYQRYMSSFRSENTGFSNSPMQVLAYGGIFLFLPYCVAAVAGVVRQAKRKQWWRMAFYIVFLYAFVITICPFQMLTFYMFISMARDNGKAAVTQAQTTKASSLRLARFRRRKPVG